MRRTALLALIFVAGCSGEIETEAAPTTPAPTELAATDLPPITEPTSAASTTSIHPRLAEDPQHRELGRLRAGLVYYDGRTTSQYLADGSIVTLHFTGSLGAIEDNHCVTQIEAVVDEKDDRVELTLYNLQPAVPAPREVNGTPSLCGLALSHSTLPLQLSRPLDGRPLIWSASGEELPVADVANLRTPAASINDWAPRTADTSIEGTTVQRFGPVVVETQSAYAKGFDRIEGLKNNPDHQVVPIADGVDAVLNRRPNGTQRLGVVWDHWFYDIIADPGTDSAELIAFVASFGPNVDGGAKDNNWQLDQPLPLDGSTPFGGKFYTDDQTLHVVLAGLGVVLDLDPGDLCKISYATQTIEAETEVALSVVASIDPALDSTCDSSFDERLAIELDEPLGARALRSGGIVVRTADLARQLTPTEIPESWEPTRNRSDPLTGGQVHFGPVVVTTQVQTDDLNLSHLQNNPLSEPIDIQHTDDGALILRADNGAYRLGFEDSGWFYDLVAQPGVDRSELLDFARSFRA